MGQDCDFGNVNVKSLALNLVRSTIFERFRLSFTGTFGEVTRL